MNARARKSLRDKASPHSIKERLIDCCCLVALCELCAFCATHCQWGGDRLAYFANPSDKLCVAVAHVPADAPECAGRSVRRQARLPGWAAGLEVSFSFSLFSILLLPIPLFGFLACLSSFSLFSTSLLLLFFFFFFSSAPVIWLFLHSFFFLDTVFDVRSYSVFSPLMSLLY
jgi:hypothetical protein